MSLKVGPPAARDKPLTPRASTYPTSPAARIRCESTSAVAASTKSNHAILRALAPNAELDLQARNPRTPHHLDTSTVNARRSSHASPVTSTLRRSKSTISTNPCLSNRPRLPLKGNHVRTYSSPRKHSRHPPPLLIMKPLPDIPTFHKDDQTLSAGPPSPSSACSLITSESSCSSTSSYQSCDSFLSMTDSGDESTEATFVDAELDTVKLPSLDRPNDSQVTLANAVDENGKLHQTKPQDDTAKVSTKLKFSEVMSRFFSECCQDGIETEFCEMVFMCFRLWCSPLTFCEQIFSAYFDAVDAERTRDMTSILQILKTFMDRFWHRDRDTYTIDAIRSFANQLPNHEIRSSLAKLSPPASKTICFTAAPRDDAKDTKPDLSISLPRGNLSSRFFDDDHHIDFAMGVGPEEFAAQLTVLEANMYLSLTPLDVVSSIINRKHCKDDVLQRLAAHSKHSDNLTLWVGWSIVSNDDPRSRGQVVSFFADLATRLFVLGNLSSAYAVWSGMQSHGLHNLHGNAIEKEVWAVKNSATLEGFLDIRGNFSAARELIRQISKQRRPCVPLLACYTQSIVRLKERLSLHFGPETPSERLIDVAYYGELSKVMKEMHDTRIPYSIQSNRAIQDYLQDALNSVQSSDELWAKCGELKSIQLQTQRPLKYSKKR